MKNLRTAFDWILLSPSLLPLVFWNGLIYPFMTPKTLLLRGLDIVALALFVYLAAAGEPFFWPRLKNKFAGLPGALVVIAYITSLTGVDFSVSFWSIYARGDGLLTLTVITGFFYLILLSADKNFFMRLAKLAAWVGSIAALFAILQWVKLSTGIDLPIFVDPANRLGGTLGNAAFLASYLGLTFFATLAVVTYYSKNLRYALYAGAALQLLTIILSATRGSFVALGIILLLALIYWGWFRPARLAEASAKRVEKKETGNLKKYSRGGLITLVVLGILFFVFRGQLSSVPFSPVQRLASISTTDTTVASRLFIWREVGGEALKTPFTGVGAEHIAILFDKVYDPGAIIEQWFDRTHDSFLDYFVQFGVFGLLLYIGVVASAAYVGWRLWKVGERAGVFLLLIVGVYALQNLFVFDTGVTLWTLFAFFAAGLALYISKSNEKESPTMLPPLTGSQLIGGVVALGLLYLLVPVVIQPLRANLDLIDGYLDQVSDVQSGIASMQTGYALGTYGNLEYGYEVYQMYTSTQLTALHGADLVAAYQFAEQALEANYNRYPYDERTVLYFAQVLASAPPGQPVDETLLQAAVARSIELSPKRSQAWYIKANQYITQGDAAKTNAQKASAYQQAVSVLQDYIALVPSDSEPDYVIASLYLTLGDKASAQQWADKGLALYDAGAPNSATANRAVAYYIKTQDWTHAAQFLEDIVADNPQDYDSTYDLAKISYLTGNVERAKELVAQLRTEKPGFVESDPAFLKALGE